MISPQFFIDELGRHGIDFYTGVPDSLLKNICAYITDTLPHDHNIIAANEGGQDAYLWCICRTRARETS